MSLVEVMIASGILLLMIGLAAFAMVAYLRSYRQYTDRGLKQRSSAKATEALCHHLRSAERLYEPDSRTWQQGFSLAEHPVVYQERGTADQARISWQHGQVFFESGQLRYTLGHCAQATLQAHGHGRNQTLSVQCDELSTLLSLRGVR